MDQTSLTELAKQHGAFLTALGGALLAMLGIVAAVPHDPADSEKVGRRRAFAASALVLVLIAFVGAYCMAEVGALVALDPKHPGGLSRAQVFASFTIASALFFQVGVGFLEVAYSLAVFIDPSLKLIARWCQGTFLAVVSGTVLIPFVDAQQDGLTSGPIPWTWAIGIPLAASIVVLITLLVRNSHMIQGMHVSVWAQLLFGGLTFGHFTWRLVRPAEVSWLELSVLAGEIWLLAVTTIAPTKNESVTAGTVAPAGKNGDAGVSEASTAP